MDATLLDQTNIELGDGGSLFLSFILAMMIFAVALGLRPSHFSFFKTDPKHYLAGVLANTRPAFAHADIGAYLATCAEPGAGDDISHL